MMRDLTFLGTFSGVSKKNGKPFHLGFFYGTDKGVEGFKPFQFFLEDSQFSTIKSFEPMTKVKADVRYLGGQDVLISISK